MLKKTNLVSCTWEDFSEVVWIESKVGRSDPDNQRGAVWHVRDKASGVMNRLCKGLNPSGFGWERTGTARRELKEGDF